MKRRVTCAYREEIVAAPNHKEELLGFVREGKVCCSRPEVTGSVMQWRIVSVRESSRLSNIKNSFGTSLVDAIARNRAGSF